MSFRRLLTCLALSVFLTSCALSETGLTRTPAPTPSPKPTATPIPTAEPGLYPDVRGVFDEVEGEKQKILLSFVGDCTIGCNANDQAKERSIIAKVRQYGYNYPFARVYPILSADDLTIANFESVLHDSDIGLKKKTYNFRGGFNLVNVLTEGSVEAVTLGNNHTSDFGEPGFQNTVRVLEESGVQWFANTAYSAKTYLYEKGGARIGFVGIYISYYWQDKEAVKAAFESLKAQGAEVIIAVLHGGVEYDARHDNNQTKVVKRLISYGADIVVGHHPHRLQGYEVIDEAPVFYSLGNFVFGGNFFLRSKYTAILQCALSFDDNGKYLGYQFNLIPCRLSTSDTDNYYQPYPVTGREAEIAIKEIQSDTNKFYPILNYQEGIGALQPFVKVPEASPAPFASP